MNNPIEFGHPVDVVFSAKELSQRQQNILGKLPGYGSQVIVDKRDVSMIDLSALTAKTGDEFAMFTRGGKRLIVRGDYRSVPISVESAAVLHNEGYRWSGHTHVGLADTSLIASNGDKRILKEFEQSKSALYNAAGKYTLVTLKEV